MLCPEHRAPWLAVKTPHAVMGAAVCGSAQEAARQQAMATPSAARTAAPCRARPRKALDRTAAAGAATVAADLGCSGRRDIFLICLNAHIGSAAHRRAGPSRQRGTRQSHPPPSPPPPPGSLSPWLSRSLAPPLPAPPSSARPPHPILAGGQHGWWIVISTVAVNRSAMRRAVCREAGLRFVVCLVFDIDVDIYLKFANCVHRERSSIGRARASHARGTGIETRRFHICSLHSFLNNKRFDQCHAASSCDLNYQSIHSKTPTFNCILILVFFFTGNATGS